MVLIGILVLSLVVGGVYYFGKLQTPQITPVPSSTSNTSREPNASVETANWKTYQFTKPKEYRLNQYAFSIKYPSNWTFKELPLNPQESAYKLIFLSPGKTYIDFDIGPSDNVLTFRSQIDNMKGYIEKPKEETLQITGFDQSIKLSGVLKPTATPEGTEYDFQMIFLKKDDLIYSLSLSQSSQENYVTVFNQILSTFKFTQ